MCSSILEVGQEDQEFKIPWATLGIRDYSAVKENLSQNPNSTITMTNTATVADDLIR